MKSLFLILFLIVLISSCGSNHELAPQNPQAILQNKQGGDEVGNGGDYVAVHFLTTANDIINVIEENQRDPSIKVQIPENLNFEALKNLINSKDKHIKVEVSDKKLIDKFGIEREALNFPNSHKIVLYRPAWKKYLDQGRDLSLLVFHELLPLIGNLDDSAQYSIFLKEVMRKNNYREATRIHGAGIFTSLPNSVYEQNVLQDVDLFNGIRSLETHILNRTGLNEILGTEMLNISMHYVSNLRGHYRFQNKDEALKRTTTFAYPVEFEGKEIKVLELDVVNFTGLSMKEKILHTFVAMLYLRTDLFNPLEMNHIVDTAVKVTECINGEMAELCWEPVVISSEE